MKTLDEEIDDLAERVNRNGLERIDPERWHAEKNDIWIALKRLAGKVRQCERRLPSTTWRSSNGR